MRYTPDCVTYLINTPMRGRPLWVTRVCLCDSRWPRALTFTLYRTRAVETLRELVGDRWYGTDERGVYFLEGWDVFLLRLPPTREAQKTDILQVHMRDTTWAEPAKALVFTIYHGLGTRDTLWEFTEGGWKDE